MARFGILKGSTIPQIVDSFRRLQNGLYQLSSENFNVITRGWKPPSSYTENRTFNPASTTVEELGNTLATLIEDLKKGAIQE